jgi:hypothetical protein
MADITESGFLSSELDNFEKHIVKAYPDHYSYLSKTNLFSQKLQYQLTIHKNNSDEIIAAILFSRTLATYQAFILISKRGMLRQAEMMLRCIFESLFALVAISKHKEYSLKLIGSEEHERLKALNKLIRYHKRQDQNDPIITDIQAKADEVKKIILKNDFKKISIIQSAEDAGLIDWYDTAYTLLSSTMHASVRSLEASLVLDHNYDIKELKNEPEINGFENLLSTALEAMKYAIVAVSEIFQIDTKVFVEELFQKLKDFTQDNEQKTFP